MATKNEWKYLSYSKLLEEACFGNEEWEELRFNRYDIQDAWIKYWWSFLSALWNALAHADIINATKIMDTFNNYIIEYYHQWLLDAVKVTNL